MKGNRLTRRGANHRHTYLGARTPIRIGGRVVSALGVGRTRVFRAAVRRFDDGGGYPIALRHAIAPVPAVAAACKVMPVLLHALGVPVTLVRTSCVDGQRIETIRIVRGRTFSPLPDAYHLLSNI